MQKTLRLVTLLAWGLSIPTYAQAPTFSLPPIPGSGGTAPAPNVAAAPQNPSASAALPPALPGLENITNSDAKKTEAAAEEKLKETETAKAEPTTAQASPLPDLPKPAAELAPYKVAAPPLTLDNPAPEPQNVTAAPPALPALALPAPPTGASLQATAIPEVKVEAKPSRPTWKDVLKPSYKPVETSFNFRRQVLPPTIYRYSYDPANRHLPLARTMPQYDHLFLLAAARNDVNAVRALLANGRRNVNIVNAEGDTALIVALRHGAMQTARLLIARGADPTARGANGWSAYDYAYYWGDTDLMQALRG